MGLVCSTATRLALPRAIRPVDDDGSAEWENTSIGSDVLDDLQDVDMP